MNNMREPPRFGGGLGYTPPSCWRRMYTVKGARASGILPEWRRRVKPEYSTGENRTGDNRAGKNSARARRDRTERAMSNPCVPPRNARTGFAQLQKSCSATKSDYWII